MTFFLGGCDAYRLNTGLFKHSGCNLRVGHHNCTQTVIWYIQVVQYCLHVVRHNLRIIVTVKTGSMPIHRRNSPSFPSFVCYCRCTPHYCRVCPRSVQLRYKLPAHNIQKDARTRWAEGGVGKGRAAFGITNRLIQIVLSAHLHAPATTTATTALARSSIELLYKRSAPEILIRHRHGTAVVSPMKTHGELMVHATVYNTGYNIIYTAAYTACSGRFRGPATFPLQTVKTLPGCEKLTSPPPPPPHTLSPPAPGRRQPKFSRLFFRFNIM